MNLHANLKGSTLNALFLLIVTDPKKQPLFFKSLQTRCLNTLATKAINNPLLKVDEHFSTLMEAIEDGLQDVIATYFIGESTEGEGDDSTETGYWGDFNCRMDLPDTVQIPDGDKMIPAKEVDNYNVILHLVETYYMDSACEYLLEELKEAEAAE